ncbi:probable glutaryl-CoA dehydrogenase [Plesiocystis pacifica SIR-1]|uniref:glutaryl-CoA dehydrogenase (ETF) n=1 Tax=Plesiocystis pacifica SIR-1 TaxID=391625 RepID=A6GB54_9BACT|nr:acyl-CoA dehydrogenase family protein [Plesiocystis pacifica]EDM76936.1 probable glutaryl-CoA dehydrogenase [Plesiocystis pacifica SIR-1]
MASKDPRTYLLGIDHLLTEDERLTWKAAHDFCQSRVMPVIEKHYEAGTFPKELIPEFAEMGFLGCSLEGYDCAGLNPVAYGTIMLELERVDSGIRSFCSVQTALAMYPIWAYGTEEQKQKWLPGMAHGELIGCFGLTEPNSGSDPGSMRTHAKQESEGGDYILNGQKMWITNSPISNLCVVWAKTLDFGSDAPVIRGFVVERGMKGLSTPETHGKLSLRASITGEIVLDDVRVPKENMLPGVRGLKGPLSCLTQARYGIGWGGVGAAMDVYERARRYTLERVQFGKPIAGFQLTQQKLVEMHNAIGKGLLLAHHCGRLKQEGKLDPVQVSFIKRDNIQLARECAKTARTMLGGNGIMGEFHIMRHLCNLETVYTYEGTHEIHTLAIGRALTGLSAFN